MNNKNIKILIGLIILMSVVILYALNLYNKPHLNVEKTDADLVISIHELLDDYKNDENLANGKYVDQVIQISGEISEITIENGNSIIIFKDSTGTSSVMCHMSPEENLKVLKLKKDGEIILKGICTGYLLDVMLIRCVLVNN